MATPLALPGPERQVKRFYRVSEVAVITGLSEPTLYREIRAGRFPAIRVRGCYVVPAKALDDMEASALATGLVDAAGHVIPSPAGV